MASKDSKKTIRAYNRLAQALLEFEALWHAAWVRSADAAAAALHAPLLARHPKTGKILVSLDLSAPQLVREARWMGRMGLALPETARLALLRADALHAHHGGLSAAVAAMDAAREEVPAPLRALLQPALDALQRRAQVRPPHNLLSMMTRTVSVDVLCLPRWHVQSRRAGSALPLPLQPGLAALTWTSLNVDGFIHQLTQAAEQVAQLGRRAADAYTNRVQAGAKMLAATPLLDLECARPLDCQSFVARQEAHLEAAVQAMAAK